MSLKPSSASTAGTAWTPFQQRWQRLSPRERGLLSLGAWVLGLAWVWWVGLAPALRTVSEAPTKQATLDRQWQRLNDLQTEAQTLQKQSRMPQAEALRNLQKTTTEIFGNAARLTPAGDRYAVTLKAVSPQDLALWLAQARIQARAVPVESHWERVDSQSDKNTPSSTASWNGSMVLSLPAP